MATKRQKKKAVKQVKKMARKYPKVFLALTIIVAVLGVTVFILWYTGVFDKLLAPKNKVPEVTTTEVIPDETTSETTTENVTTTKEVTTTTKEVTTTTKEVTTTTKEVTTTTTKNVTTTTKEDVTTTEIAGSGEITENVIYDDFQIHFMQLGNSDAGDSIYIKAGDTDILIDAGSQGSSATTLESYINQYCTDGKLEYVIATHSDTDHIVSFAGNADSKAKNFKGETVGKTGIFYYYDIDTFIDFNYCVVSKTLISNKEQVSSDFGSNTTYGKYLTGREYAISNGTTYYTAADCFGNENGASSEYVFGNGIKMDILYNYYYYTGDSDNNNNHSVVTMFTYNNLHYLLTGDLEQSGEEKLAAYYNGSTPEKTLPQVELFKAGHHGSYTASNECLLSLVQPKICVASCCAGTAEYTPAVDNQFPSQDFINRIAKYTDRVYVTSMIEEVDGAWKYAAMNGNVIVSCDGVGTGLSATNNLTKLKDTEWFNETIYAVNGNNVTAKGRTDFFTAETTGAVARKRRTWPEY